jgi:hypothetical protein
MPPHATHRTRQNAFIFAAEETLIAPLLEKHRIDGLGAASKVDLRIASDTRHLLNHQTTGILGKVRLDHLIFEES